MLLRLVGRVLCSQRTLTSAGLTTTQRLWLSSGAPELLDAYADLVVSLHASSGSGGDDDDSTAAAVRSLDERAEAAAADMSSDQLADLLALRSRLAGHQPAGGLLRACESAALRQLDAFSAAELATAVLSLSAFAGAFAAQPALLERVEQRLASSAGEFSGGEVLDVLQGFSRLALGQRGDHQAFFASCERRLVEELDGLACADLVDAFVSFRLHGRSMSRLLVEKLHALQDHPPSL